MSARAGIPPPCPPSQPHPHTPTAYPTGRKWLEIGREEALVVTSLGHLLAFRRYVSRDAQCPEVQGTVPHNREASHQLGHLEKLKETEKELFLKFGGGRARIGTSLGVRAGRRECPQCSRKTRPEKGQSEARGRTGRSGSCVFRCESGRVHTSGGLATLS